MFCFNVTRRDKTVGGDRGAGTREKGYGRRERKELETGVFGGPESGTTLIKR